MSLKEKAAYLKGLAEGLGLDADTKEGKLITVIIDLLIEVTDEIDQINENALNIGEELDAISDDLADVEEYLFDDDDDDDDDDFDPFGDYDDDDEDCDCGCDCEDCAGGNYSYEVECPACGAEVVLKEADFANASAKCSACGEELVFEFGDDDEEDIEI